MSEDPVFFCRTSNNQNPTMEPKAMSPPVFTRSPPLVLIAAVFAKIEDWCCWARQSLR